MWETISAIAPIIAAFITGIAGPVFLWWIKESRNDETEKSNTKKDFSVNEEVKFAKSIKNRLEEIRRGLDSDRVWIAQFHNGGRFLNSQNESMKRLSVTYEVTGPGISKEQNTFSEVLVSFFSEMVENVIEKNHIYYNEENIEEFPEVEVFFRQRGTESMHLLAVRNIDETLIGILGVEYISNGRKLTEDELQYLKAKSNLIGGYIFYKEVHE